MTRRSAVLAGTTLAIALAGVFLTLHYRRTQYLNRRTMSVTTMLEELHRLHGFEDSVYRANGTYVADISAFRTGPDVARPVVVATRDGWTATVTHTRLGGVVCGIAVGMTNPATPRAGEWWTDGGLLACREGGGS